MASQIGIINKSRTIPGDVLAFAAKACDAQVIECAAAWGVSPTPVAFYAREEGLPARDVRIMAIVDDIDAPGALGYHDDALGVIYGRVLAQGPIDTATTLSHECLEELVDPTCDKWMPMPDGRSVALEVCDAVEADTYDVPTEIMGETRSVRLSNFVLPKWFDPAERGGFDRMGILGRPFSMSDGGYLIVRDRAGNESNIFARPRLRLQGASSNLHAAAKLTNSETRLARRMRG
jgi:hypothetical protein